MDLQQHVRAVAVEDRERALERHQLGALDVHADEVDLAEAVLGAEGVEGDHRGRLDLHAGVLEVRAGGPVGPGLGDVGVGAAHAAGALLRRDQKELARLVADRGVDGRHLLAHPVPGDADLQDLEREGGRLKGIDAGLRGHLGHDVGVAAVAGAHVQADGVAGEQVGQIGGLGLVLGPAAVAPPGPEGVPEHA
jgi:hypothetical protein